MRRNKSKINLEGVERFKSLLKEKHTSQVALAEAIHYTQQQVSAVINGKRPMTQEFARSVADVFPGIRAEWLLGKDKHRTYADLNAAVGKTANEAWMECDALDAFARYFGYSFKSPSLCVDKFNDDDTDDDDLETDNSLNYNVENDNVADYNVEDVDDVDIEDNDIEDEASFHPHFDERVVISKGKTPICECSLDDQVAIMTELHKFLEYQIYRLCNRES